jgi:hypothetical protein
MRARWTWPKRSAWRAMKGCSGWIDLEISVSFQSRGVSPTLTALRAGRSGRRPALVPSPSYSGERDRVRGGRWSALEFRRVRIADHLSTRAGERSAVRTLPKCIVHSTHFSTPGPSPQPSPPGTRERESDGASLRPGRHGPAPTAPRNLEPRGVRGPAHRSSTGTVGPVALAVRPSTNSAVPLPPSVL